MAVARRCDSCGKEITDNNPLVMKLWATAVSNGKIGRTSHNNYTHSLDVGQCCLIKVNAFGKWAQRKKQKARVKAA